MKDSFGAYYQLTGHEGQGGCFMCGATFKDNRRRRYCSADCTQLYLNLFWWPRASCHAINQAHHKCQQCGVSLSGLLKLCRQRLIPGSLNHLEVHHKEPLGGTLRQWSLLNQPYNLIVLCPWCHHEAHRQNGATVIVGVEQSVMNL